MTDKSISVVVLAYNEVAALPRVIEGMSAELAGIEHEIIIVDDGSNDGTAELADRLAAADPQHVRVIHHATNLGGGAATRTGLFAATKDYVLNTPGDGQFVVGDIARFLAASEGKDAVISYRSNRSGGLVRALNSFAYRTLIRLLFGIPFRNINWVKLYRRERIQSLHLSANSWLVDTEILYWFTRLNWKCVELEVTELPRVGGRATGANPFQMFAVARELWRFRNALKQQVIGAENLALLTPRKKAL
jgi:glycosyltransferase involved in cell wall biosynthesis